MDGLVQAWQEFQTSNPPPYVLLGDEIILEDTSLYRCHTSWEDYIADDDFDRPGDNRLHLGLLPLPYVGNLKEASIFILMLNPGFGPQNYYVEYKTDSRKRLVDNLQQRSQGALLMDPEDAWLGGYSYWNRKLREIILSVAKEEGKSFSVARKEISKKIAMLELSPYFSTSYSLPAKIEQGLRSVKLAQSYARDVLVQRAKDNECLIVVTRAVKRWNLEQHKNIIQYNSNEARGASLSLSSRGGHAIRKFLQSHS